MVRRDATVKGFVTILTVKVFSFFFLCAFFWGGAGLSCNNVTAVVDAPVAVETTRSFNDYYSSSISGGTSKRAPNASTMQCL